MIWLHPAVRDQNLVEAYQEVKELAAWSDWADFMSALAYAPREPGVYLFREPDTGLIRYVGMAGERAGSGRPQGLYGRLSVYRTGKGAVSGFGEAALDRALGDADWVERQLLTLRERGPRRAKEWARDAVARLARRSAGLPGQTPRTHATWRTKSSPASAHLIFGIVDRADRSIVGRWLPLAGGRGDTSWVGCHCATLTRIR